MVRTWLFRWRASIIVSAVQKVRAAMIAARLYPAVITFLVAVTSLTMPQTAHATEIKVVSGGAFKQVLNALATQFRKDTGTALAITYRTVGQHLDLIRGGTETFDVAILTPEAIDGLIKDGKVAPGTRTDLAKTGIGVVVKAGAALPDISSVEAFRRALLAAKSVAYIDPKAGGSSGIYIGGLLVRLGIADQIAAKAVLVHGGAVADHIADGEAEIGIHQISEILPVKGVTLVGPLPADIQNFTVYAAGAGTGAKDALAARKFLEFLSSSEASAIMKAKGMEPVAR
jgi:molybdate transport system substrate-binding protein